MKILLVKLTSMGDLIQTFPAITDAKKNFPNIKIDWVVEESFQNIAKIHPGINKIITFNYRKWKGNFLSKEFFNELKKFYKKLRHDKYDMVIDAQSNIKSSLITLFAKGKKYGLDKTSVREYGSHFFYNQTININRKQNHLIRMRKILAIFLGYSMDENKIEYGILNYNFPKTDIFLPQKFVFINHLASRKNKLWPEIYWDEIIDFLISLGYNVVIPWWSEEEKERSLRFKKNRKEVYILPNISLLEKMAILKMASFAISLDTGLGHMAAALNIPNISLSGPSSTNLTGPLGENQFLLGANQPECAPCQRSKCHYSGGAKYTSACLESIKTQQVKLLIKKIINL